MRTKLASGKCPRRGSALLAVLWLTVALSAIAFAVAANVRGETERTSTSTESLRAYYLASGSIDRATLWVYWGMSGGYSYPDGSPRYYRPPMPYLHYSYPTGDVQVEVIPEAGKLNVNTASQEDLARLLFAVGIDTERAARIASGIIAYRSAAEAPDNPASLTGPGGSSFQPRNASLQELEEILLVPGMTPDIFYGRFDRDPTNGALIPRGGLRECLTVWGSGNRIDINTAPAALLESVGVPAAIVKQIVDRRVQQPFKTMDEVNPLLQGLGPETARIGIGGATIWTLRATARMRLPGGRLSDVRRTVSAVVKFLDPGSFNPPFHTIRWYDDAWSPTVGAF